MPAGCALLAAMELIIPRWVAPVVPDGVILSDHAVALEHGRIVALAPAAQAREAWPQATVTELPGHLLVPGFVNLHTHAPMSLLRGAGDDMPLQAWLRERIWPLEAKLMGPEFVADGTVLACAEMLRGGITCFNDMYFFPEAAARAVARSGMRAVIGLPLLEFPTAYAADADDYLDKGLAARDALRDQPLLHFALAPHAPYTSDAVFNQVLAHNPAALSWQARWQARREAYVDWADQQEAEGWRYQHGEHPVQRPLGYGERSIELYGKLDRVDRDGNGEQRVLDYKTTAKDTLKKRLKEHDDHQLPFYGLLLGPAPVAAGYVVIDDETPALLPAKDLDAGHCRRRSPGRQWQRRQLHVLRHERPVPEGILVSDAIPAFFDGGRPIDREEFIRTACDPSRSVIVEACAGSGKTWLLVSRMLRLLLAGAEPGEMLAITFTRKAAQEMRERLIALLSELALETDEAKLLEALTLRGLSEAEARAALPSARTLYARVLASPHGLSVDTFHSWFTRLLQIAPLSSGVPHGYGLEENTAELREQAWLKFMQSLNRAEHRELRDALMTVYQIAGDWSGREMIEAFVAKRAEWQIFKKACDPLAALNETCGADGERDARLAFWEDSALRERFHAFTRAFARRQ